jgi:hypothetical protein
MEEDMHISGRLSGVIASLVIALTVAGAVPAQAAVASHVTIGWNATNHYFHGTVTASNQECVAHRIVKVFKKTSNGRELVGKTTAKKSGHWKVSLMAHSGKYFAKAPAQTVMSTNCAKARSHIVDVM